MGRFLRDRRLRQGSYSWPNSQNATGSFAEFWQRSLISLEGPQHKKVRTLAIKALSNDFVLTLRSQFNIIAQNLCAILKQKSSCEFQSEFSMPFSGQAICILLGLTAERWTSVAHNASILGLAMGLNYKTHEVKINAACHRLSELAVELISNAKVAPNTSDLVGRLITYWDQFEGISYQDLIDLIVIVIFGGVDTTRGQIGFLMAVFARHPKQWQDLRIDPSLIPNAVEEAIRAWPTTTWATREIIESFEFDGILFAKGVTVHLLVHSSAKDPALGNLPEFDIHLQQRRHHGFGGGAHHCLGYFVARTDMASAVRAIANTFKSFSIGDTPVYLPDSGNTSSQILPLSYEI